MELKDYLAVLRKNWLVIAIIMLLGVALAAAYTLNLPKLYTSTSQIFFSVQMGSSNADLAQGSTYTERQMASFAQTARSPLVLDPVIAEMGLEETSGQLAARTTVQTTTGTVIMRISVVDENPDNAATLANAVTQQLIATVPVLTPPLEDGTQPIRATVLTIATPNDIPTSPNIKINLALGLLLGFALGFGYALLRTMLDTQIRGADDLVKVTDLAVIGSIPWGRVASRDDHAVVRSQPNSHRAEAIRHLRTNLQFVDLSEQSKTMLITSSVPGEGKSTIIINLAIALADAGSRVVLVDADLRRPTIAKKLGLEGSVGLTTVLIGRAPIEQVLQPWKDTRLTVLAAGQIPPNPSELLGTRQMAQVIRSLSTSFDYVLVDTAPLLPVTDATVISRFVSTTVLVVGADRAQRGGVAEALGRLEKVDANVAGVVLNKIDPKHTDVHSYQYYGSDDTLNGANKKSKKKKKAA